MFLDAGGFFIAAAGLNGRNGRNLAAAGSTGERKMAEELKGVEDPSAANLEKPGVNPSGNVSPKGTPAAEGNQEEVAGLKAAAVAEREKRQIAEADAQTLRDQLAIQAAQTQAQPQRQMSLSQSVAKQLGIDLELATPEEICQINEGVLQVTSGQQTEQSFINSHPDYAEVVGVTLPNGVFQPAAPLSRELKANPALADALRSSPNKAVLAYSIASKDPQYLKEQAEKGKSAETIAGEKAAASIKAANTQLSVSAAKGGGTLDNAARRQAQTNEEFLAENEEIMAKAT